MTDEDGRTARERYTEFGTARLFTREIGSGTPIIVVHGGPDFDHSYFLPELDRLSANARLIYYDQRGRGRSADGVRPDHVTIASEVADLDAIRRTAGLDAVAILGHSWGGLIAMEYATRHPDRVTHVILMHTAPASHADWTGFREHLMTARTRGEVERMREIAAGDAFRAGDIESEAEYYDIHFRPAVRDPELHARIVGRLRQHFEPAGILLARAIEDRLYDETSNAPGFDLAPRLSELDVPALVIHAEDDFVPLDVAEHIAAAMPRSTLSILPGLGHFAFVERPDVVAGLVGLFLVG